jgi:Na+-driven multidrug efflux pump
LYRLFRAEGRVRVRRAHLRIDPAAMRGVLRLSGTGTVQVLVGTASWVGLVRILSSFGSEAVAGYTIGVRIIMFALLPSWGVSNAAATMVGQALGATKPDRAERAVWTAGFYNMIFLGTVGLLFVLFATPLTGLFTQDPAVHPIAADCLRVVSFGFLFYAYGMVLTQSFNGAGDTRTPTLLNLLCFWLWEIPLAYLLSQWAGWGPRGVFTAVTVAFSTLAVASALVFRRGRWKLRAV